MTPEPPVWNGFTRAALDAAYNNTAAVSHSAETLANLTALSEGTRARFGTRLDWPYGPAPRQKIDLFSAGKAGAPLFVFIHGGYWQRNAKEMFSVLAEGPMALGFDAALIGYTLAPDASLTGIIAECETAIRRLKREHPGPLVVSGWSAGGHLAARLLEMPEVDAALSISGVFDLEPIRHCYLQEKLQLTPEEAKEQSPIHRLANAGKPISLIVGGAELPELRRQSADYAAASMAARLPVMISELPGLNHFSILDFFRQTDPAAVSPYYPLLPG